MTIALANSEHYRAELRDLVAGGEPVAFLVGAGISSASFPVASGILSALIQEAVDDDSRLQPLLPSMDVGSVGLEIALNDLRQTCRATLPHLFEQLATVDDHAEPTASHEFLARWLDHRGVVVTTNFDRLIERRFSGPTRFDEAANDETGFLDWERDVQRGVLVKLHGSLARTRSCLGALEDVGTSLTGARADLVSYLFRRRPICIVGWRGADPDIPPVLLDAIRGRSRDLPIYWVLRGPDSIERVSRGLQAVALERPILADADELFTELMSAKGGSFSPSPPPPTGGVALEEQQLIASECTVSTRRRFVGIIMRRAGHEALAGACFEAAAEPPADPSEWAAARQESALTLWGSARGETAQEVAARRIVKGVVDRLRRERASREQMRGPLFGLLSMTVSLAPRRPWLMLTLPRLFQSMRRALLGQAAEAADDIDRSIQKALTETYLGRARIMLVGGRSYGSARIANWVLTPFRHAETLIEKLPERSLHARFDVIASHSLAAARLGQCVEAAKVVSRLDYLATLLHDERRKAHWEVQRSQIVGLCPPDATLRSL